MNTIPVVDFKSLFETLPGLYLILNPGFTIVAVSDAYLKTTMTERKAIIGHGLFEIFPDNPDDKDATGVSNLRASLNHVLKYGQPHKMAVQKYDIRKPDGVFEERYWSPLNSPVFNEAHELVYIIHQVDDVTSHQRAEEKLKKSEKDYLFLVSSVKDYAIFMVDTNGLVASWNSGAERIKGYTADEIIGKSLAVLYTAEDIEQGVPQSNLQKAMQYGHFEAEGWRLRKDGTAFWANIVITALKDEGGMIYGYSKITRDITEQKKLREQVNHLASIVEQSSEAILSRGVKEGMVSWNRGAEILLGYSKEEAIGKTPKEIGMVRFADNEIAGIEKEVLENGGWKFEKEFYHKNGSSFFGEVTANAVKNEEGEITSMVFIIKDISLRKQLEDQLKKYNTELEQDVKARTEEVVKSESRFRALIENSNDIISLMDKSFNVIYRSPSAARITGWSDEDLLGINGTNKIHPDDIEMAKAIIQKLMANPGKTINTLFRNQHKDGHYLWVEGSVVNLLQDEDIKAIVFNFRDVSARIEAEAELAASEQRFRLLIENSADGIDLSDEFSNNIYRSPGAIKITGNLQKENQMGLTHPDDVEKIKNLQEEFIKKPGIPIAFQSRFCHALGHYIWLEGTVTNLLHVEGVHAYVTNFRDITKRKELEVLLHNANVLARIGSWEIDMIKGTVYWSDITREIHETDIDYVPDLASGINFYKEGPGRDLITQKVKEAIELCKPWDVDLQIVTAKNNERWVRSIGETEYANGKCIRIYGSFQDIDERKKAEIERERLNERFQLATHSAQLGLWDWDVKNNKLIWDEAMYRLYNLTENEFTTVYDGWASRVHAEDRQRIDNDIQLALAGKKEYNPEFRIVWPDSSVHYINASGIIERDHDGNAVRMTGFNWDVTERKTAEEKIKNINIELEEKVISRTEQLRRTNEELEAFSYSVSHDLRAPLRGIIGFTNILEEDYTSKLDDEAKRITGVIKTNTLKMGHLIDDLLAFSRMGRKELPKAPVDINSMVQEIIDQLKATSRNPDLQWVIEPLPVVNADIGTIRQVWINLLSNAIKYSSNTKQPQITIGHYAEGGQQVFFIKDNGVGFNNEYKDKLFRVFQRLHSAEEFEGTGVGLALVGKIIFKHGGKVWAEGEVNKGASFYFSLPIV